MDTRLRRLVSCLATALCSLALFNVSQRLNAQAFTQLHSFGGPDGAIPDDIVLGNDGNFYGTTEATADTSGNIINEAGTIYRISPTGAFTSLFDFPTSGVEGFRPTNLKLGSDGNFYGSTPLGGNIADGNIFRFTPSPVGVTSFFSFNGTDGEEPSGSSLVIGPNGNFYGTTVMGGANNDGVIYQISPSGSVFSVIHSFSPTVEGSTPNGLVVGSDGNLYGSTITGGVNGSSSGGTIYRIAPDGSNLTVLHTFTGPDGVQPTGALFQGHGRKLLWNDPIRRDERRRNRVQDQPEWRLNAAAFVHRTRGANPEGGVIQLNDGNFYGPTELGGGAVVNGGLGADGNGSGNVFKNDAIGSSHRSSPVRWFRWVRSSLTSCIGTRR